MNALTSKISISQFMIMERDRLVNYVRRFIEDTGDRDGEDIVQDVALRLLDRPDVLTPIEALSSYVYQSLRNRVIDYLRRRRTMVSLDEPVEKENGQSLADQLADEFHNTEKEVARSELRTKIFEAIDSLPYVEKAIVIETEVNGKSFRELSEEWAIPLGTLLARKSRALAKVRELLREFKP
jgi:RNA polymerase sigma factor (sigma-70 family)